jgi:hypothetical protein
VSSFLGCFPGASRCLAGATRPKIDNQQKAAALLKRDG